MLENEGELVEDQPEVVIQPDPEAEVKRELVENPELLEEVSERKMRKFAPSGLVILLFGIVLIVFGLYIHSSETAIGGLGVGVGFIIAVIGMCRILIGLIRPIVPSQLR